MICGKIIYKSKQEALQSANGMQKDKGTSRVKKRPVKAYYCNDCEGFHITSRNSLSKSNRNIVKKKDSFDIVRNKERKSGDHNKILMIRNYAKI